MWEGSGGREGDGKGMKRLKGKGRGKGGNGWMRDRHCVRLISISSLSVLGCCVMFV